MEKINAPENLRVKLSKFKSPLTFNEWAEQLRVSSQYSEYQPLFEKNPSYGLERKTKMEHSFWGDLKRLLLLKF